MNQENPFIGKSVAVTGKLAKAQMLGISVMSEQEFEDATGSSINGGGS